MRKISDRRRAGALLPDDLRSRWSASTLPRADTVRRTRKRQGTPRRTCCSAAAVTVARVAPADFTATVQATGSLVAREEILVGPEVEGLRVTEVLADEGMRVKKGDVLARLVADTLDAQLAQNDAGAGPRHGRHRPGQERHRAGRGAPGRAQQRLRAGQAPAGTAGHYGRERLRPAASRPHARPRRSSSRRRDGLKAAEAEKAQIEAQRRELTGGAAARRWWRRPTASSAAAWRAIGGYAAGAAEPMFRIVAKGEVELDAEVTETRMAAVKVGQPARVEVAGVGEDCRHRAAGLARSRQGTRLGRVRIYPGRQRGSEGRRLRPRQPSRPAAASGLAVPASADPLRPGGSPRCRWCATNRVETRRIKTGLAAGALAEVREGLQPRASWWSRAPAPSCATAMRCGRCPTRPKTS